MFDALDRVAEKIWESRNKGKAHRPYVVLSLENREILRDQASIALNAAREEFTDEMSEDEVQAVGRVPKDCRYPDVIVRLSGENGNAFSIMARVVVALKGNRVTPSEIAEYEKEATSGDYDNLIQTTMKWVNVL